MLFFKKIFIANNFILKIIKKFILVFILLVLDLLIYNKKNLVKKSIANIKNLRYFIYLLQKSIL